MAAAPWTCEQCGAANAPAARACGTCAAPAPGRSRARALWALVVLMLVAAAAVGVTFLLAARDDEPDAPAAGPFPSYTTPSLPATTVTVTSREGVTPAPATSTPAGRPCPAPAAGYLPGGAGTALLVAQTAGSVVTICRTPDGAIFYDGQARDRAPSPGTHITLPAERSGDGFVAANGDYRYTVGGGRLVVTAGPEVLSDDVLTPVG